MWRSLDVDAVLAALPDGAEGVVAGATGASRQVRRPRLVSRFDDLRHASAHELVVASAATLTDNADESWDALAARLDAGRIAGLAVRLDAPLPAAFVAAADRLALPVIGFSGQTQIADVMSAVLDALLEAQGRRLERVLDIHQRFTRVVAAGGGTVEVASTLHAVVGLPIAVLDAEHRPLAVVPTDVDGAIDAAIDSGVARAVRAGDHEYGQIVALTGGSSLDADGLVALERAATAIAVRLAQASAVAEAHERFASISLEELIAGRTGDLVDIAERANSFGWDLSRPRAVLLASIDPPTDQPLDTALGTLAAAARATLGRDAIVWTRTATVAALIAPDTADASERRRIAERLRDELDHRLTSVTVSIGVGRRVDTPALLARSFVEASRAVDVGRWAKGRHVTEVYDQLGLERLLASTPADDLAEFVEHAIGPLVAHDRANHTDLTDSLGVWLDTRNMAEAARRIHVHYNTFKNRLDRIESIIGPVVTDAAHALECEIAIYVARHYHGPWTTAPVAIT